jgi:hypothetical protein
MQYRISQVPGFKGGYEYIAELGEYIYDHQGNEIGFKTEKRSPQGFYNEVCGWVFDNY